MVDSRVGNIFNVIFVIGLFGTVFISVYGLAVQYKLATWNITSSAEVDKLYPSGYLQTIVQKVQFQIFQHNFG